jgi:hypothetical protein
MSAKNDAIVAELKRIQSANRQGLLLPAEVELAARPIESVLHDQFQWDDTKAAYEFRLAQARALIQVAVTVIGDEHPVQTRVFVSLKSDRVDGGYRQIVDVIQDDGQRAELLQNALDDFNRVKEKYEHLLELTEIFAAIKRAEQKVPPAPSRRRRRQPTVAIQT